MSADEKGEAGPNGGSRQRRVKSVTGQTQGQLIDLHYVNYGCDVERGMKNGSRCRTAPSERTPLKLSADLEAAA